MSNDRLYEDAFNFLCMGQQLGQGAHREVFACRFDASLVIKVENNGDAAHRSFMNVKEFDFWGYWSHYEPVAKWLAPCLHLSPDGRLMTQRRVDPIPQGYKMPDKLPAFLTDHKEANFGLLDGRLVSVDYGTHLLAPNVRLKPAFFHT